MILTVERGINPRLYFVVLPPKRPLRLTYRTPECWKYALSKFSLTPDQILSHDTLVPECFGGFGNQFNAFIRGLFICYIFGYNRIAITDFAFCFNHSFHSTDGIEVVLEHSAFRPLVVNSYESDGSPECPLDDVRISATIRDELVGCLPTVSVNDSTLYICARGGDIMAKGTPYSFYGQPPCHYFTDAMHMDGHPTVVMSNNDPPSPCVQHLVKLGAVYGSLETPFHDLARLVHSRRIVISRTTFTAAAMLLSKPKDVLYAFVTQYSLCIWPNHTYLLDYYDRFGPHHKCRATPEYDENVLKEWHATDEQMHVMETTEKGCVWEFG
jgi:hypothetical protein